MAVDPKFAEQIEKDIAGIPQAHRQMYAQAKMDGMEIHGFAVFRQRRYKDERQWKRQRSGWHEIGKQTVEQNTQRKREVYPGSSQKAYREKRGRGTAAGLEGIAFLAVL